MAWMGTSVASPLPTGVSPSPALNFSLRASCLCVASLQIPSMGWEEALSPVPLFQGQASIRNRNVQAPGTFSIPGPLMKSEVSK